MAPLAMGMTRGTAGRTGGNSPSPMVRRIGEPICFPETTYILSLLPWFGEIRCGDLRLWLVARWLLHAIPSHHRQD